MNKEACKNVWNIAGTACLPISLGVSYFALHADLRPDDWGWGRMALMFLAFLSINLIGFILCTIAYFRREPNRLITFLGLALTGLPILGLIALVSAE